MSNLIVLDFDGIHTADEVLNKLRSLQKEHLIASVLLTPPTNSRWILLK